ncbi:MAG: phosphate acetyltransferase [Lachnospiraceae bacterium]|nr:phosphate acetyltransferase [Lachnospiraceae bacterium]
MSDFIFKMTEKARKNPKRVAFPESESVPVLQCCARVVEEKIGTPVLVGNPETIKALAAENGVNTEGFEYFDNNDEESIAAFVAEYMEKIGSKEKIIRKKLVLNLRCAMMLLKLGRVDCVAAGKECSTGDVIVETMSVVGMQEGVTSPSSLGIAEIPGFDGPQGEMLGLADCAITAWPNAEELAGIAIASADTVKTLLDWEPRVALLAFSTTGSAEHETIDVVREAVGIVHEKRPDIKCDGEFQLDSAIIPAVAEHKVKRESEVAGKANIIIFPNLHAGNIGVKLIQIFGHANAYGPVLQGFAQPVCDFSRSAPVEEMLGNVAMLIIRAGA